MIAKKFAAEKCNVAINYVSNKQSAEKVAADIETQYKSCKTVVIQGVCCPSSEGALTYIFT